MAILIRKVQSFRKSTKVGNQQCRIYKITKYGLCLIKFMCLMFGSLKTHILEVNGSNTHVFQMFQDFRITSQLFGMLLVPTCLAMKVRSLQQRRLLHCVETVLKIPTNLWFGFPFVTVLWKCFVFKILQPEVYP